MTLTIKARDWAVLRCGEIAGPITGHPNNPYYPFRGPRDAWTENGEYLHSTDRQADEDAEHDRDIIATLPRAPLDHIKALEARISKLETALRSVKYWADARCPMENDDPKPCPVCGASVDNLEACKSAENIIPRSLLSKICAALEASQ